MIYVHWLIIMVYALVVIGSMVRVLMDHRQPAKTMAWMLVLLFLPLVGIVLYFFFGQNTRKEKMISQHSLDQLTKRSMLEFAEQKNLILPSQHEMVIKLFASQNWALPFKDNEIQIYTDGYSFFHALLRDISKACHHIHLDTYIFNDDELGHLVADALIAKALDGVEVRVVYDDVGCWDVKADFFERMRDAGVEVHGFMPVKFPAFTSKVNYRNHRKICVIDGVVGFIGGMNIATRYVQGRKKWQGEKKEKMVWRDTHLRIQGGAVYGLQKAFLVDWYFVDRTLISSRQYYPLLEKKNGDDQSFDAKEGYEERYPDEEHVGYVQYPRYERNGNNCIVQIVTSSPISQWPDIMQGYVRIILEAKKYVYMETPYFLPTEPVLLAIRTAALTGVDVRVMIPLHTDAKIVEWASRSYIYQIVHAGVKVYFYKKGFNHSKLLVSDDSLCTVGSTNVDFRSFENNFEGNAFIYDRDMALRLKAVFMQDVADSVLLDDIEDLDRRPFYKRLWESLVRMLSPLL